MNTLFNLCAVIIGTTMIFHSEPKSVPSFNTNEDTASRYTIKTSDKISTAFKYYEIIRPVFSEKRDGKYVEVQHYGTGFLNKDSVPVGEWQFFSAPDNGRLLYRGKYHSTKADDFFINDPEDIGNLDTLNFKKDLAIAYAIVKSGVWKYYTEKGEVKDVIFPSSSLPIFLDRIEDTTGVITLFMRSPERKDEWTMKRESYR